MQNRGKKVVKLSDGRYLMAKEAEILAFFEGRSVVGKTITDIYPELMDYGIGNLEDLLEETDDISVCTNECAIQTDGLVFLELNHGSRLGIRFSGSGGPVVLKEMPGGSPCSEIPSDLFSLNSMFDGCRGKKIANVIVDRNNGRMLFPCVCGIDMSVEDEGVWQIRLILDDGSCLAFHGFIDWGCMEYRNANGDAETVPLSCLLADYEKPD